MTIFSIQQDSKGYIWFGTANGVCRYDGVEVKHYLSILQKDNEMLKLTIDQWDRVWFINLSGQLFYIDGEEVVAVNLEAIDFAEILYDFEILDDKVYLSMSSSDVTKKGTSLLAYFEIGQNRVSDQIKRVDEENYTVLLNLLVRDDRLIFSANNSLYFIHKDEPFEAKKLVEDNPWGHTGGWVFEKDGYFFFSRRNKPKQEHVMRFHLESGEVDEIVSENLFLKGLKPIGSDIWGFNTNGITRFSKADGFAPKGNFFQGIDCNTAFRDREGNIWVGTNSKGIHIVPATEMQLYSKASNSIPGDEIFCMYTDTANKKLLVGLSDGNLVLINEQEKLKNIYLNTLESTRKISKDQDGLYWVITESNIVLLNSADEIERELPIFAMKTFMGDSKGGLWFGGYQSTTIIPKSNAASFMKEVRFKGIANRIVGKRTYSIFEDRQQNIWIGTTTGVYVYDGQLHEIQLENRPYPCNVSDISQTNDGSVWVSTLGSGLIQIKGREIQQIYSLENGLSSNSCKVLLSKDDQLWVGTNKGANVLNLNDQSFYYVNKTDGLPTNEINSIAYFNSKIWIGTPLGMVSFPAAMSHQNEYGPPVHITRLKIWEKDTTLLDSLTLKHNQNNLHIEFVGLGLRSQGNIEYQYRLKGVEENWVSTDARFVRYPAIAPGNYIFEVVAINEDGVASTSPARVHIVIKPAWWNTWWARLLGALIFTGFIGMLFYVRYQRVLAAEQQQQSFREKINELKHLALQTQMNPHFIFNALNSIQHFLSINDQEQAMIYLSRFARLIRIIFEQSKLKKISLEEEIEFLEIYLNLEKLRFKDKVEINFQVDEALRSEAFDIKIPPLLLQPVIENAFKHGLFHKQTAGHLSIHLSKAEDLLVCIVEDNGIGRQAAAAKSDWKSTNNKSSGLNTTRERLNIVNAHSSTENKSWLTIEDLKDVNGDPSGTRVTVNIIL